MNLTVTEVNIYPVKSCGGLSLPEAHVGDTGFDHDREWMVTSIEGNFITQRQNPKMALIIPELTSGGVKLSAPGKESVTVPINNEGESVSVVVWADTVQAVDQGDVVADWLTSFLGRGCRLVRMKEGYTRKVKAKYAVAESDIVSFADGYPVLLISQASLDDLNSKLTDHIAMNRFRPNLVIGGGEAFQEDTWKKVKIGEVEFALVKACARCEITTVDQKSGVMGTEPLETLGKYRTGPKGIMFGQNLIQLNQGNIKQGDKLEILEYHE